MNSLVYRLIGNIVYVAFNMNLSSIGTYLVTGGGLPANMVPVESFTFPMTGVSGGDTGAAWVTITGGSGQIEFTTTVGGGIYVGYSNFPID